MNESNEDEPNILSIESIGDYTFVYSECPHCGSQLNVVAYENILDEEGRRLQECEECEDSYWVNYKR